MLSKLFCECEVTATAYFSDLWCHLGYKISMCVQSSIGPVKPLYFTLY